MTPFRDYAAVTKVLLSVIVCDHVHVPRCATFAEKNEGALFIVGKAPKGLAPARKFALHTLIRQEYLARRNTCFGYDGRHFPPGSDNLKRRIETLILVQCPRPQGGTICKKVDIQRLF